MGKNYGRVENEEGRPFVGPGGRLLDRIIAEMQLFRSQFYITNLVKCYSQNDVPPTDEQVGACKVWLEMEIQIINPIMVVLLGNQVVRSVLDPNTESLVTSHGKLFKDKYGRFYFAMHHPGYMLRNPAAMKATFEQDMPNLKKLCYKILEEEKCTY